MAFPIFFILVLGLVASTFIFGFIYYTLPKNAFYVVSNPSQEDLSFSQAMHTSVSTQTLLGMGDVIPRQSNASAFVMIQSAISLLVVLFATTAIRDGAIHLT